LKKLCFCLRLVHKNVMKRQPIPIAKLKPMVHKRKLAAAAGKSVKKRKSERPAERPVAQATCLIDKQQGSSDNEHTEEADTELVRGLQEDNGEYLKLLIQNIWNDTNTDLIIRLNDDTEIAVHHNVIASSCPAWKGLLGSDCKEVKKGIITVDDVKPDTVRAFVKALYFGYVENSSMLPGVIGLAERYQAKTLLEKLVPAIKSALKKQSAGFCYEVVKVLRILPKSEIRESLCDAMANILMHEKNKKRLLERVGIPY